jgi:hypothetical protein
MSFWPTIILALALAAFALFADPVAKHMGLLPVDPPSITNEN